MDVIYYTKISKLHAKKGITYPMLRFPKELDYIIGKNAVIYMVDSTHFLVEIQEKNPFEGFKTFQSKKHQVEKNNDHSENKEDTKLKPVPRAGIEPATFRSSV